MELQIVNSIPFPTTLFLTKKSQQPASSMISNAEIEYIDNESNKNQIMNLKSNWIFIRARHVEEDAIKYEVSRTFLCQHAEKLSNEYKLYKTEKSNLY
ncbi:1133_t:CDS:2 [Dentiscutata heterogama]|uniref:1133_t:CDS:1 n=1 Tax=Dentiscutata heterogama TaxID=1316150 RepID=A0ACA9NEF7_9GLOM|nr:1133_t:CDS:2 [Dentiscutata heterogama]